MTIKFLSIVAIVLAPLSGTARAEPPSYTIEDVTACSKDAMKLCRDKLPDLDAIEGCMKANYESLGPACQSTFRPGQKIGRFPRSFRIISQRLFGSQRLFASDNRLA